jgi:pimeloyl-ACP methyl ester carboxylesterase
MKRLLPLLAVALLAASACGGPTQNESRQFLLQGRSMTPCTLARGEVALCGVLRVPEDPSNRAGRSIDLQVAVHPAVASSGIQEPVFFVAGGPGDSAVQSWAQAASIFPMLDTHHDIVLVDQRGTGGSNEMLVPPIGSAESATDYASRVLAGLPGDPRYYTTSVAMDDLDAVRAALGYSSIDLYGGSYGATAVQYYLRQHGDRVHLAVLDGGTLLDVPIFELFPASSQRALDGVLARCRSDEQCNAAFPDPAGELTAVLARLTASPVTSTVLDTDGRPTVLTADFLAGTIHGRLLSASSAATIPWLIHRAAVGDFDAVVKEGIQPSTATRMMALEILCSEAWARFDPAAVATAGAGSYLLPSELSAAQNQAQVCPMVPPGVVPPGDALPVSSQVPVLLLNGEDDPQDPPANVAEAQQQMPNSVTLVARAQGHTVGNLGCLPAVVVAYFDTGRVDQAVAKACAQGLPLVPFKLA